MIPQQIIKYQRNINIKQILIVMLIHIRILLIHIRILLMLIQIIQTIQIII
jgi:hypothetical protein